MAVHKLLQVIHYRGRSLTVLCGAHNLHPCKWCVMRKSTTDGSKVIGPTCIERLIVYNKSRAKDTVNPLLK